MVRFNLVQKTGLREEYQFSNYEFSEDFVKAFQDYKSEFKTQI